MEMNTWPFQFSVFSDPCGDDGSGPLQCGCVPVVFLFDDGRNDLWSVPGGSRSGPEAVSTSWLMIEAGLSIGNRAAPTAPFAQSVSHHYLYNLLAPAPHSHDYLLRPTLNPSHWDPLSSFFLRPNLRPSQTKSLVYHERSSSQLPLFFCNRNVSSSQQWT